MPINQYLLAVFSGTLLATRAVTAVPPGRFSTRTCNPALSGRGNRTPQPRGLTTIVWQFSAKEVDGSRLLTRTGICARTRVPRRR
jgi:hypothetical protein